MIKHSVDVAIIGAGPAGLAAAISAKENGANDVLVLDRNSWLGGILPQCIHDGFGVEETGTSMTGPEYADIYIQDVKKLGIDIWNETMVLELSKKLEITAINKKGLHKIKAKAIILAMGCREKTRWNIVIPGDRPSGIFTAGVAQAFINLYNIFPGKNVVILGSGDVGLIIARRLKFEGANVLGIVEILPYASGLPRNVVQCLDDYDIPMFLNHTVTYIKGRERLESVTISHVDSNMNPIPGTEKELICDTLLLSLGLIPENELSKEIDIKLDDVTGGPIVNQDYMTSVPGIFVCGNCLQVYDTVDALSIGAKHAGKYAVSWQPENDETMLKLGKNVRCIVPQKITRKGVIRFTLRVKKPMQNVTCLLKSGKDETFKKKLRFVNPANMVEIDIKITKEMLKSKKDLEVSING
jgi:thioredoxin reductase